MNSFSTGYDRRSFCKRAAALVGAAAISHYPTSDLLAAPDPGLPVAGQGDGFRPLFDGKSLKGWTRKARELDNPGLGVWTVKDGMIISGQDRPGVGSMLVSDETFGDFEVEAEVRPDWPADTGLYVRAASQGIIGYQCLIDYRPHGALVGYFGDWIGGWHACDYCFTAEVDAKGQLVRLIPEKPSEPLDKTRNVPLDFCMPAEEFLRIWNLNGWNKYRVRCVGAPPRLTTWINDQKAAELDTAKMRVEGWYPDGVGQLLGRAGYIALEVHGNVAGDWLGNDRWAPGAVCRWRNIRVKTL